MTALAPQSVFAGQFRIVQLLSQGGFGSVYVAEQAPTGHRRALKVMHPDLAEDPRARERFIQEAQLSAHIESEHVAQVVAAGLDAQTGIPWLAMELLQGRDLAATLAARGRIPPAEALEMLRQLGHALAAAHHKGIVHRDLKPENIFIADARRIDAAFTVKVLDFGIARWLHENRAASSSAVLGSPLWMAPEQFETTGMVSPATDIWALGLIAFAMLTGRSYWRASSTNSLPALVSEVTAMPLVSASQRAAELGLDVSLPPGFDAWFSRCLQRDPSQRFREAGEATAAAAAAFEARAIPATMAIPASSIGAVTNQGPAAQAIPRTQAIDVSAMPWPAQTPPAGSMGWNPGASPSNLPPPSVTPHPMAGPFTPNSGSGMQSHAGFSSAPVWGLPPAQGGMSLPSRAPTPTRSGGWLAAGIVIALLVVGGGAIAAVMLSDRCADGEHRSEGRCCREGTEWNGTQRACVAPTTATPPGPIAPQPPVVAQPVAPQPMPAQPMPTQPMPTQPNAVMQPIPSVHACVGSWGGSLNPGTRNPGVIRLGIRGIEGTCGQWGEVWYASGARCNYTLRDCQTVGDAITGTGYSSSRNCVRSVSVSIRCSERGLTFRETYNGNTDSGRLSRR